MVNKPTRRREGQTPHILDLVIVNDTNLISDITHATPFGKSDHETLIFELYVNEKHNTQDEAFRYDLSKGKYSELRKEIAEVDWKKLANMDVDQMWNFIKNKIHDGMDKYIPKVKCNSNNTFKPGWLTAKVRKSVRKKYCLYKRFLNSNVTYDYQNYIKARNKCKKEVRKAKKEYERKLAKECKIKPKYFWKYVQSKTKVNTSINPLKTKDGFTAVSDLDKAEVLNKFFASVFTREDTHNMPTEETGSKTGGILLKDIVITSAAVHDKLKGLNPNKAQGPDQIPPKILKELCVELSSPLSILFNLSIEKGQLPKDWKKADVIAIFKKGSKSDPSNYRPVSLTSVTCKVLESLIRDQVVKFMDDYKLYSPCQHGFRKHRSCMTQLLEVIEDFSQMIDNSIPFDVIYLDFRKAFDSVPHKRLLTKLEAYGISGNLHSWIADFLKDREQKVRVGSSFSSSAEVLSGIPQGSILGPILFTLFINDLPDCVTSCCKIFADDTKIYNDSSKSADLQADIDRLLEWSTKWNLFFNDTKCKIMHIGKNNPLITYTMQNTGGETEVSTISEEKDLGVIFDNALSFETHIQSAINKANQILGIIKRSFDYLSAEVFVHLYKALVRPHLEYGNVIWSPFLKRQSVAIEKVQRRATRLISNIKDLPYEQRLATLKLPSLKYRRFRGDLIQYFKIMTGIDDMNFEHLFSYNESVCTRSANLNLHKKYSRTNLRKFSFTNRVISYWNALSTNTKSAHDLNHFKALLDSDEKKIVCHLDYDT